MKYISFILIKLLHLLRYAVSRLWHSEWRMVSICFMTACTFWVFRSLNKQHQKSLIVPKRFDAPYGNYMQLLLLPEHIKANVSATGWVLARYCGNYPAKQNNTPQSLYILNNKKA